MTEIHGIPVIAMAITSSRTCLVMLESWAGQSPEWIVSGADHPDDSPDHWHGGHYFRDKGAARAYFLRRLTQSWEDPSGS